MKCVLFSLGFLFTTQIFGATCPKPAPAVQKAFAILANTTSAEDFQDYVLLNSITKDVRNENCETLYFASIRFRNNMERVTLEKLNYAPEVQAEDEKLKVSAYQYAVMYGDILNIQEYRKPIQYPRGDLDFDLALKYNDRPVVSWLMDVHNIDLASSNYCDSEGVLYKAIRYQRPMSIINLLLRRGAPVEDGVICRKDETPLALAARTGNIPMLETLIKEGARIGSALNAAIQGKNAAAVKFLLDVGATPVSKQYLTGVGLDNPSLPLALYLGAGLPVIKLLVASDPGALKTLHTVCHPEYNTGFSDCHGDLNLLMIAAAKSPKNVIQFLISQKIDVRAKAWNDTALTFAKKAKRTPDILNLLKVK